MKKALKWVLITLAAGIGATAFVKGAEIGLRKFLG